MAGSQSHTRRSKTILFDRYLTPFLAGHGFVRDRRTYRRFNDLGDCVMVDFQPSGAATRYEYVFYVNPCATPRPWMDSQTGWLCAGRVRRGGHGVARGQRQKSTPSRAAVQRPTDPAGYEGSLDE